jgi:hypothetical protein
MTKFYVVHGSVALPPKKGDGEMVDPQVASIGEPIVLTDTQAEGLIASGFVVDEKTFIGMKKMVEGAAESGVTLDKRMAKFAAGLAELKAKTPVKGK